MNERIQKLAEQAGIHPTNFEPDADIKEPLEKFAELIVGECVDLVKIKTNNDQLFADKTYQRGYLDARADSAFMIKEHFGIEE